MGRCQQQGSVSTGLDDFFFFPSVLQGKKKNQYLVARHDRGIISELKWLSGIVIWWLLFAIVLLSPHFSPPPLPFTRFFPSPLSEFPWWHFMLQFENSRARDQVQENLFETNWWTGSPSTFVSQPPSFLISSSCLPRPPLCSRRNLFVVYLHSLIPDKDEPDACLPLDSFSTRL